MGVAPTVYRWDDAGAPGRPSSNGNDEKADFFATVFRACLVQGYGDKPPAGWTELSYTPVANNTSGELVLQNGSQTGVVRLILNRSYGSLRDTRIGVSWDGQLQGDAGGVVQSSNVIDDVRSVRWAVIANDASAILLIWRDPASLTVGRALSDFNWVGAFIGSVLGWGSELDARAAPNFVFYAPTGLSNASSSTITGDFNGFISLIDKGGAVVSGQAYNDFRSCPGRDTDTRQFLDFVPQLPLCPAYIVQDFAFARYPGWLGAMAEMSVDALVALRDQGLWTGDQIDFNGQPHILIASSYRFGLISLSGDDWP